MAKAVVVDQVAFIGVHAALWWDRYVAAPQNSLGMSQPSTSLLATNRVGVVASLI